MSDSTVPARVVCTCDTEYATLPEWERELLTGAGVCAHQPPTSKVPVADARLSLVDALAWFTSADGHLITDGMRVDVDGMCQWRDGALLGTVRFNAHRAVGIASRYFDGWFTIELDEGGLSRNRGTELRAAL